MEASRANNKEFRRNLNKSADPKSIAARNKPVTKDVKKEFVHKRINKSFDIDYQQIRKPRMDPRRLPLLTEHSHNNSWDIRDKNNNTD